MPHISLKMLEGRTPEQKAKVAAALVDTLCRELGVGKSHVTLSIEDFDAVEWQDVFRRDVTEKADKLFAKPMYDPKDLL